jgi:hypothetical protein
MMYNLPYLLCSRTVQHSGHGQEQGEQTGHADGLRLSDRTGTRAAPGHGGQDQPDHRPLRPPPHHRCLRFIHRYGTPACLLARWYGGTYLRDGHL